MSVCCNVTPIVDIVLSVPQPTLTRFENVGNHKVLQQGQPGGALLRLVDARIHTDVAADGG